MQLQLQLRGGSRLAVRIVNLDLKLVVTYAQRLYHAAIFRIL